MDDLVKEARRVMALPDDERHSVVRQASPKLMVALQLRQIDLLEKLVALARDRVPVTPAPVRAVRKRHR